jgi:predicted membrane channel-forming protein YqfA (hemolysin III family)
MALDATRKAFLFLRDLIQTTLFSALTHYKLLAALSSGLTLAIRPLLGIVLALIASLQLWGFLQTVNKNIDAWLGVISSLTNALLTNIGAIGSLVANLTGTLFLATPWLFVAAFGVSLVYQLTMLCLNAYRAYESNKGSSQREHYLQALMSNAVIALQLAASIAAVCLFTLTPASAFLVGVCALVAVLLIVGNAFWRMMSDESKSNIKKKLGIISPEHPQRQQADAGYQRIFTARDHKAVLAELTSPLERRNYLVASIEAKLVRLQQQSPSDKIQHKLEVLKNAQQSMQGGEPLSAKADLSKRYPQAWFSFWCEKGDVEQLIDAVISLPSSEFR